LPELFDRPAGVRSALVKAEGKARSASQMEKMEEESQGLFEGLQSGKSVPHYRRVGAYVDWPGQHR
jgi:hypothetical protein